jgi:hypothetical protein
MLGIQMLEMKEFLYAATLAERSAACELMPAPDQQRLLLAIRKVLRIHRFDVMCGLIGNGVSIPAELLSDEGNPEVGQQQPDKDE